MNNLINILSGMQNMMANPSALITRLGLPQNALQNPQMAVQQLVNSGRMSQQQLNEFYQMAQQIQAMPQFKQMFR